MDGVREGKYDDGGFKKRCAHVLTVIINNNNGNELMLI